MEMTQADIIAWQNGERRGVEPAEEKVYFRGGPKYIVEGDVNGIPCRKRDLEKYLTEFNSL